MGALQKEREGTNLELHGDDPWKRVSEIHLGSAREVDRRNGKWQPGGEGVAGGTE